MPGAPVAAVIVVPARLLTLEASKRKSGISMLWCSKKLSRRGLKIGKEYNCKRKHRENLLYNDRSVKAQFTQATPIYLRLATMCGLDLCGAWCAQRQRGVGLLLCLAGWL